LYRNIKQTKTMGLKYLYVPSGVKAGTAYGVMPNSADADFDDFTRNSTASRIGKNGFIESVGSNVPRLDYSDGGCPSLLLEPERRNLITYSEDFSQWNLNNVGIVVTDNTTDVISPSGITNASKVEFGNSGRIIYQSPTLSGVYSGSVYVKGTVGETIRFSVGAIEENFVLTGNWDRILKENITAAANTFNLNTYGGVTARTIYLWGAQLEQGSYATSYIPTSGSAVTRAADLAGSTGDLSDTFNDSEGVLMAEIAALADDLTFRNITISDGSNSNIIQLRYRSTSNVLQALLYVGGVGEIYSVTLNDITIFSKALIKYKENDVSFWVNGFEIFSDTLASTFPNGTLNVLRFQRGDGAFPFYGNTKQLRYYDTTDIDLEELTSWDSFRAMAEGQNYVIE
jgi:hypothetical protein